MPFFGTPISQRQFIHEVQTIADFLNLTTLERRKWTNLVGISRIAFFLIVIGASHILAYMAFVSSYWRSQNSTALKYLCFTVFGTLLIVVYILVEFSRATGKLRRVVRTVAKVDTFLIRSAKPEKSRLSYFRAAMVFKYVFFVGMSSLVNPRFRNPHVPLHWILITQASILILCFMLDICIRKFTIMVHFIERRLKVLEDLLRETWERRRKGWQQDVQTLIRAHDLLCDSCSILNSAWKRSLVLLVCLIFLRLVHGAVDAIVEIKWVWRKRRRGFVPLDAYESAHVITYWLWNLFDITHYAQRCESQVKRFNSTLYCLVMSNTQIRNAEPDLVDTLLIQLGRKRKVVFTAHGLFPVNYSMVHSVLAGVFTSVIFILQSSEEQSVTLPK